MVSGPYRRGVRFEHKVRRYLEGLGYVVLRSARSRLPDLVALREGERPKLVECKIRRHDLTRRERARLMGLAECCGAEALIAYRGRRGGIVVEALGGG